MVGGIVLMALTLMLGVTSAAWAQCSNPTYQGYGITNGGAGQTVVKVTNLNDSGSGSLRNAVGSNRCVEFDVEGEITLTGGSIYLNDITNMTIDGFSAPGQGITLRNCGIVIQGANTNHTIIRGIRIRMEGTDGQCKSEGDGFQLVDGPHHIILDHNSISGALDENLGIAWFLGNAPHDITVSWNIFADPQQPETDRVNVIIAGYSQRVSFHHNLTAHGARHPRVGYVLGEVSPDVTADVRNNLSWLSAGEGGTYVDGAKANAINNFFLMAAGADYPYFAQSALELQNSSTTQLYTSGNVTDPAIGGLNSRGNQGSPFTVPFVTTTSAEQAACEVRGGAGVFPRDAKDQDVIGRFNLQGCGEPEPCNPANCANGCCGGACCPVIEPTDFDFALEHNTAGITVPQWSWGLFAIHATLLVGDPQDVTLSASGLPTGVTVTFWNDQTQSNVLPFDREQGPVGYNSTYTVRVTTTGDTPTTTTPITLTASGGGVSRSVTFPLTVVPVTGTQIRYVSPSGSNGNPGTSEQPWQTLQFAANNVAAGWTVVVRAGEYRERVTIVTSGTEANPITWIGEVGATINGAQPVTGWSSAGGGIYEKSISSMPFGGAQPAGIIWEGKYIPWLLQDGDGDEPRSGLISRASSDPRWDMLGAVGYMAGSTGRLRFNTDQDPDNESFEMSAENQAAFDINTKHWNTFTGFTVKNAHNQFFAWNGATGNTIKHCRLIGGQYGVNIIETQRTTVSNNEFTLNYWYVDHGHPINTSVTEWNIYVILRKYMSGHAKHASIMTDGDDDTTIMENHVYRHFSGINMLGDGRPNNMRISRNFIHHVDGYSLEMKTFGLFTWIHDNLFYENTDNVRIDTIQNDATIYFYRNRLGLLTRSASTNPCAAPPIYCGPDPVEVDLGLPGSNALFYIYHNSLNGHQGVHFHSGTPGSSPNFWLVNNILSSAGVGSISSNQDPNSRLGHNWVGGGEAGGWSNTFSARTGNVVQDGSRMWNNPNPSYRPGGGAVELGLNLSAPWGFDGVTHPALPGMSASPPYFLGGAPDAGTFQAVADEPPQPVGPIVNYKCNGNFLDDENGFTATQAGGVLSNGPAIVDGNACVFDGVDAVLTAPVDAAFRPASFGVATWTSLSAPASPGNDCDMMRVGTAFTMGRTDGGRLRCALNNGAAVVVSPTAVPDNVAHLMGCGFDQSTSQLRLWLDNVNIASQTVMAGTSLAYGGSDTLKVGGSGTAGRFCAFNADNIRMNDAAWTDLGMAQVYAERIPAMGLSSTHWRFYQHNAAEGTTIPGQATDASNIVQARSGTVLMGWNIKRNGSTVSHHYSLECNLNGGAFATLDNSCAVNPACIAPDNVKNMGDFTTDLGDIPGDGFTFTPGRYVVDAIDGGIETSLADGRFTVWRYGLKPRDTLAHLDVVRCRPRTASGVLDTYPSVLPTITIDAPAPAGAVGMRIEGGTFHGGTRQ